MGFMAKSTKSISNAIMAICVLVALLLILNVALSSMKNTIALGLGGFFSSSTNEDSEYTTEGAYLDGYEASVEIMSEGTVLLKNENSVLPLGENAKVTLLGAGSYNYVEGGTGSGGGSDDEYTLSMYDAFAEAGLDINDTVWNNLETACGGARNTKSKYTNNEGTYFISGYDSANAWYSYQAVHEFSIDVWKDHIASSSSIGTKYKAATAIVTISRSGAEGASPSMDYDGDGYTLQGETYLELTDEEEDLLVYANEQFENVVVLVNSATPMELGFIDDEQYGIDACLWIGHPGEAGLVGVGYVLSGDANPSGALVDTYAYDMTTTPSYYNTDNNQYSNGQTYYQYEEGIYVGYRYYETADATGYFDSDDFIKGYPTAEAARDNYGYYKNDQLDACYGGDRDTEGGYENVVQFPFGYGLSYTTFSQEITGYSVNLAQGGTNSITVEVTNTGDVSGMEVVQLYMEAPYNNDSSCGISGRGLEKSVVVLIGFAKTSELKAGESEEVTIYFQTDDLASYDNFGNGCYVLESGTYYFNIQDNAHCWGRTGYDNDNTPYGTVTKELSKSIIYNDENDGARDSDETAAVNCMDDVTAGDGNMLEGYLSRSDFASGMKSIMAHASNESTTSGIDNVTEDLSTEAASALATRGTNVYEYTFETYLNGEKTEVTENLYAYANNAAPWMETLPDGTLVQDVTDEYGEVEWDKEYYVVVDSNDEVITTTDANGDVDFEMYESIDEIPSDELSQGSARLVTIDDMAGVSKSSENWKKISQAISLDEAITIQANCGWSTPEVTSVGKEATVVKDGPAEPNNGGTAMATWFPCAVSIAATWNPDLAYEEGVAYGEQANLAGLGGSYAPAMNTHRSPFGGRNFEYYSEDGFIAGQIGGSTASGIMSTGTNVYVKHLALNDGDTNRGGVATWANEQAIREIYMKPYEISVKEYEIDGIMGSLNRIGMSWAHYGMYTTMLRDEWGWYGHLITDGDGSNGEAYNNPIFWLAGTQGSMLGSSMEVNLSENTSVYGTTAYESQFGQMLLQKTAMHLLYQYANSGMTEGYFAWWWVSVWVILDVLLVAGVVAIAVVEFVVPVVKTKKGGGNTKSTAAVSGSTRE